VTANNPDIPPGDFAGLLRSVCAVYGIQCLRVKSAKLNRKASENEFVFEVEFLNANGTLLRLARVAEKMRPISRFSRCAS